MSQPHSLVCTEEVQGGALMSLREREEVSGLKETHSQDTCALGQQVNEWSPHDL